MCGTWTQEQWEKVASNPGSAYSVVGKFKDTEGNEALQIAEIYSESPSYYWNIYSEDGKDHTFHYTQPAANERLEARGFTPVEQTTTTAVTEATERDASSQATDDGVVRVQEKTLEEWKEIGKQNENLPESLHTHPEHPRSLGEDRSATDEEMEAFVNSMTIAEALEGLELILGGAEAFA